MSSFVFCFLVLVREKFGNLVDNCCHRWCSVYFGATVVHNMCVSLCVRRCAGGVRCPDRERGLTGNGGMVERLSELQFGFCLYLNQVAKC